MTRKDEAIERALAAEDVQCVKVFTMGALVYRPYGKNVQTGTIRKIRRVSYNSNGDWREDENGEFLLYTAQFGNDWESQSTRWKFFDTEALAWKRVAEQMARRAADALSDAAKYQALADAAKQKAK